MNPRLICALLLTVGTGAVTFAQQGGGPVAPPSARAGAAAELTGTWVSVVTEEWKYRMVTPRKGDYRGGGIHLLPEGKRVADLWDPAKDEAAGEQCKGYGAVGVSRLPGKVRIGWQDDNTLKVEFEAGNQIRFLRFGATPPASSAPSWQGYSVALWERAVAASPTQREGNLKIVTTHLRPQYARKNGLPVSGSATLSEYLQVLNPPGGTTWLSWIGELDEPQYYLEPYHYSWQFKKVPDNSPWSPEPCTAR